MNYVQATIDVALIFGVLFLFVRSEASARLDDVQAATNRRQLEVNRNLINASRSTIRAVDKLRGRSLTTMEEALLEGEEIDPP